MYEAEIRNGLDLFDEKLGRDVWFSRVVPERLSMKSCQMCIAAQATGLGYTDALHHLGVMSDSVLVGLQQKSSFEIPDDFIAAEIHYGFEVDRRNTESPDTVIAHLAILEREWQDTIAAMKFPD